MQIWYLGPVKLSPYLNLLYFKATRKTQLSGSDKLEGLSSSAMLAEAKDSVESIVDREETVSESESTSSWTMMWSSSISDVSDPDAPPSKSLFIADFAVSTNHSSAGSALKCQIVEVRIQRRNTAEGKDCKTRINAAEMNDNTFVGLSP